MGAYSDIKGLQKNTNQGYVPFYLYRPISAVFSTIFVKLGFSANFVTFLAMLSDFLVVYLMYLGLWIPAGILVNLGMVLDCSDGEVARYYIMHAKKKPEPKHYGAYVDEVLGTIGFTSVVYFAGYFMGAPWIALFAMSGLFMVIITAATSKVEFPNKQEIVRKFEEDWIAKVKGRIGFDCGVQRLIVSIAVIFASSWILLAFGALCHLFYLLKFWVFRNY